jgi:diguanylate cyclase (GGDEF)-like protein
VRRDPNQPAPGATRLTADPSVRRRRALLIGLSGAALFILLGLTGLTYSPLFPLLVVWLVFAGQQLRKPLRLLVAALVVLLVLQFLTGTPGYTPYVLIFALVLSATVLTVRLRTAAPTAAAEPTTAPGGDVSTAQAHVLEPALEGVRSGLHARRSTLWVVMPEGMRAHPLAVRGGSFPDPVTLSGDVLGWCAREGVSMRAETPPPWVEPGARACALAPVSRGVLLSLEFADPAALPAMDDLDRAAAYLAAVIELERERAVGIEQRRLMEGLMAALQQLPAELEPVPLAKRLAESAMHLAAADGAAVAIWDGEEGRVIATAGQSDGVGLETTFSGSESETALAARADSMIIRSERPRGSLPVVAASENLAARARSVATLPLRAAGNVVGTLTVWSAEPHLHQGGLESIEALVPYAALQFRHALTFGQLRERADRDRLTGLLNRQAFDAHLAGEFARYQRYQRPFVLLLIDIDHFKSVNDRYGHQAGDAVLANVGRVLIGTLREVDFAARYGGEEFAILLPETELTRGSEIAERIRTRLADTVTDTPTARIAATASIGVSACPFCAADADALVRTADAALYRSKQAGRNRVTLAPAAYDPGRLT